jgi:hypothetical protein
LVFPVMPSLLTTRRDHRITQGISANTKVHAATNAFSISAK